MTQLVNVHATCLKEIEKASKDGIKSIESSKKVVLVKEATDETMKDASNTKEVGSKRTYVDYQAEVGKRNADLEDLKHIMKGLDY